MNLARNEFLADARLTQQQNARRRLGHSLDALQHASQSLACANNATKVECHVYFFAEVVTLLFQLLSQMCVLSQRTT